MKYNFVIIVTLTLLFPGCSSFSMGKHRYKLDEPELQPYSTMYEIEREKYCLTEIDPDSVVEIERNYSSGAYYDVMLHIYGKNVSRTVAFERQGDQYIWLGEQELHYSGHQYRDIDGTGREKISVTYHIRNYCSGCPAGLSIRYTGDYHSVIFGKNSFELNCEDVKPYIEAWDAKQSQSLEIGN